jgi:hypothetical protein
MNGDANEVARHVHRRGPNDAVRITATPANASFTLSDEVWFPPAETSRMRPGENPAQEELVLTLASVKTSRPYGRTQ